MTDDQEAAEPTGRSRREQFTVGGADLAAKLRELLREGNVRRIVIKNKEGQLLVEVPLTVGIVGAVLVPLWAALGAVAALLARYTIEIERRE
ncbi:MAG: DUF4342 domain-containing protein [Acidimicrobiia bacterium]